ncbi:MAG: MFS transporter [Candidatus Bathyarchaeia archaeon]
MTTEKQAPATREVLKVATAAGVGGLIEYFDFFIASFAAATVWPQVFFPGASASIAASSSFATFGLVFFTRPLGAYIFGHVGDRLGRRNTLVYTLLTMGIGLFGIGVTPSYAAIGDASIVLLIIFRLLFGLGLGGEFGGAVALVTEFASKSKWRSFWNLWATPIPIGLLLASLSFSALASWLKADFLTYGWRIPFIIGAGLVVVGLLLRYKVQESPLFEGLTEKKAIERAPASQVLRIYWRRILLLAVALTFMSTLVSAVQVPYSVNYLVGQSISRDFATLAITYANIFGIFTMLLGFFLGDMIGRRRAMIFSLVWALLASIIFFPLINTLNPTLIVLGELLLFAPTVCNVGPVNALFAESFPTKYRYSGSGLAYQMGTLISGVITAILLPVIIISTGGVKNSMPYVAVIAVIVVIASFIATLFIKETKDLQLTD